MSIWVVDANEPEAMRQHALSLGVPDALSGCVVLDYTGQRTDRSDRDTCYRAGYILRVEEAVLVTQWHGKPSAACASTGRCASACDRLGIDAVGVAADRRHLHLGVDASVPVRGPARR